VSQPKIAKKIHKTPYFWCSRSFTVIEFGTNQEPVYDFLLVINSNLSHISHRYCDKCTKHQFIHLLTAKITKGDIDRITLTACQCVAE